MEKIVNAIIVFFIENAGDEKKRNGSFYIKGTNNIATLSFTPLTPGSEQEWWYTVGVRRDGTDMMISHYLKSGGKDEVLEYLKTNEAKTETIKSIEELSNKVDDKF